MKTARAKSSWLNDEGQRLDAGYHLSPGHQAKIVVESSPNGFTTVGKIASRIFYGGRARRYYVDSLERGTPFISSSGMMKADLDTAKIASNKHTKDLASTLITDAGWTLISRSGTVGNVSYSNANFLGKAATEDIIRVVPNDTVLSGYLYAYLSSNYGYGLMTQGIFGAVIQHIEPHHIAGLPVPRLPAAQMQQIHEAVEQAAKLREDASKLLAEANEAFIAALQLEPGELQLLTSPNERDISASRTLKSSQISALSLRGRNYGLRLEKIINVLSKGKWQPLTEVLQTNPFYTGRFKRLASTAPTAVELYSQSDLFALKPQGQIISARTVPNDVSVAKGSILVAGVGTLGENEIFGRAKLVWGYLENKLVAQHIIRFVPDEKVIDAGYLFTVLNSKLWFRIFRSSVCGTSLLSFIIPLLNKMPIPRLGNEAEHEIGRNVKLAYEKLTEAIQLETQAIHEVESAISAWQK